MLESKGITVANLRALKRAPYSVPFHLTADEFEKEWNYVDKTNRGALVKK